MTLSSHIDSYVAFNVVTSSEQVSVISYPHTESMDYLSCSRDESICAHVIERGSMLATSIFSSDGLLSDYAEYVGSEPSDMIRTYVGETIKFNSQIVATLCFFSSLDIMLTKEHKGLLATAARLIENVVNCS